MNKKRQNVWALKDNKYNIVIGCAYSTRELARRSKKLLENSHQGYEKGDIEVILLYVIHRSPFGDCMINIPALKNVKFD